MAKFYGSATKSGRVGGSVFAIRHGETIERQYQPVVNNPKSTKQVTVRSVLKLLSQISAALASIIAFRREGNVSPRNLFTRANFSAVGPTSVPGEVSIDVEAIDLTGGAIYLPQLVQPIVTGDSVAVALSSGAADNISRVLYALVGIKEEDRMNVLDIQVNEVAGNNRTFETTLGLPAGANGRMAIFAFGVADLNERARVSYEDYKISGTPAAAVLAAVRSLTVNDVMLTETVAASFTLA